ncbi:hypothetical protein [Endozoicomonas sp. ALC020]|uniref:hypothetical protein n=1 Tax=unclassified Endozoicomonas TaxID=2644528 RepID=UPI003BAE5527
MLSVTQGCLSIAPLMSGVSSDRCGSGHGILWNIINLIINLTINRQEWVKNVLSGRESGGHYDRFKATVHDPIRIFPLKKLEVV